MPGSRTGSPLKEALQAIPDPAQRKEVGRAIWMDTLTPMGNLKAYRDFLDRNHDQHWHLHVDLNNFKFVNDTFSHDAGNDAIRTFGQMASKLSRAAKGKAFRSGGDEFVFSFDTPEKAQSFIQGLDKQVSQLTPLFKDYKLSFSAGIGQGHTAAEESLKAAKAAKASAGLPPGQAKNHLHFHQAQTPKTPSAQTPKTPSAPAPKTPSAQTPQVPSQGGSAPKPTQPIKKHLFRGQPGSLHGWISPDGEYTEMAPDQSHSLWIDKVVPPNPAVIRHGLESHPAYEEGWLSVGHGGGNNIHGHSTILDNLDHPATRAAMKLVQERVVDPEDEVRINPVDGDRGRSFVDITARRFAKFGSKKPSTVQMFRSEDVAKAEPGLHPFEILARLRNNFHLISEYVKKAKDTYDQAPEAQKPRARFMLERALKSHAETKQAFEDGLTHVASKVSAKTPGEEYQFADQDDLEHHLHTQPLAMLSAIRQERTPEENDKLHEALKEDIKKLGYSYTPMRGHYDGEERSYMVHGIPHDEAAKLARKYNQQSHIQSHKGFHGETSHYPDYTPMPGYHGHMLDPNLKEYYSEVQYKGGGLGRFRANLEPPKPTTPKPTEEPAKKTETPAFKPHPLTQTHGEGQALPQNDTHLDPGPAGWKPGRLDVTRYDTHVMVPVAMLRDRQALANTPYRTDDPSTWLAGQDSMSRLGESIKEKGFRGAVSIGAHPDGKLEILDGTHRAYWAEKMGMSHIPARVRYYAHADQKAGLLHGAGLSDFPFQEDVPESEFYGKVQDTQQPKADSPSATDVDSLLRQLGYDLNKVEQPTLPGLAAPPKPQQSKAPKQLSTDEPKTPLTVQGRQLTASPDTAFNFNDQTGELFTPRGTFKVNLHDQPYKLDLMGSTAKDYFNQIVERPDIQRVHQRAMKNWQHLNRLLHEGKVPEQLIAHSALFTILSANNAVPMQELSYSRLMDSMKKRGINPSDVSFGQLMGKEGGLRADWKQSDDPRTLPTHSRKYWQGPAGTAIIQQSPSEETGRKSGDIYKMQYLDSASDKLRHYPQLHGYLTDLVKRHGPDARSAVGQMMADKAAGKAPMDVGAGFGSKVARYFYSMLGGGSTHVPDTHLIRHLFGLDSQRDSESHKYLKDVLWDPKNHHLLNKIDQHYGRNYPTVKYVQDKYFGGKDTDQAIFPAFWLHWLTIAPHEKALGIGKPHAAKNVTDHSPYWDSASEILGRHGFDNPTLKSEAGDEIPVYFRTASAVHDLKHKFGPSMASMVFFADILPHLLKK